MPAYPAKFTKPKSVIEQQAHFLVDVAALIVFVTDAGGYLLTGGDLYRDPRVFGHVGDRIGYGAPSSEHKRRLAIDLNLFKWKDGSWQYCYATEDHRWIGEHWESMGHIWGGRNSRPDGNHYEY